MKKLGQVGKYNLFKAISTLLTVGSPIITLSCCSDFFVTNANASMSATGIFTLLISALFLKDKIAETLKIHSAFVLSTAIFILIVLVENILQPMKIVCLVTMITSGIDKFTFEKFYKRIEVILPDISKTYMTAGFIFTTSEKLLNTSERNVVEDEQKD